VKTAVGGESIDPIGALHDQLQQVAEAKRQAIDLDALGRHIWKLYPMGIADQFEEALAELRASRKVIKWARMANEGENPNFWNDELDAALAELDGVPK
jgi:hypothetical protein